MTLRALLVPVFSIALLFSVAAEAAQWPSLPAACTPERAAKWDNSKSENMQAACHCPPTSMCPQTYAEYSEPGKARMPAALINRCCPEIKPPVCPSGSALGGQPVPVDGECNPKCPAGTDFANQLIPADGNCNRCKRDREGHGDGNASGGSDRGNGTGSGRSGSCGTVKASCPAKYYPSLTETGLDKLTNLGTPQKGSKRDHRTATIGKYQYADGNLYEMKSGGKEMGLGYAVVGHLPQRYNWSLRLWEASAARVYGWAWMGDWSFYTQATDGGNLVTRTLAEAIAAVGAQNLTWFGFSVVKPTNLANNLVSGDALTAWGGSDRIAIGQNDMASYPTYRSNNWKQPAIEAQIGDAIAQCRKAQGEYIELDRKMIDGQSCAYMQCRYVYSDSGYESCLAGDVKVSLADGTSKAVKELKVGDVVKGSTGDHKIVASNIYQSALRVLYGVNGGGELLTGDHPLHTKDGWKVINPESVKLYADKPGFAKTALAVGDVLITDKGGVEVKSIERHAKVNPVSTYNIKVEGNAGFYANGIEVKGFDKMEMHYE